MQNPERLSRPEARSNDRMPYWVMDALWEAGDITLHITWTAERISSFPAVQLWSRKHTESTIRCPIWPNWTSPFRQRKDSTTTNPETSGILSITTPETPDEETEEITDPDRGLAETPELRDEGVEQTILRCR